MKLKILNEKLSVCKIGTIEGVDLGEGLYFLVQTDEELSLVCETSAAARIAEDNIFEREDGWRGFRIEGVLDFGLIGILSKISGVLAEAGVGIFAVSTYNTDYVLMKEENFEKGMDALSKAGYEIA